MERSVLKNLSMIGGLLFITSMSSQNTTAESIDRSLPEQALSGRMESWTPEVSRNLAEDRRPNRSTVRIRMRESTRGPEPDDFKHVLSVNQIYNLPFGQDQHYLRSGIASRLLGNWQFNGIWSVQSGARFTPYLSANVSNASGGGTQRPNAIGSGMLPKDQRTIQHWFNTADFVAPPQYTYGDAGTGMLTDPGYFNADLGPFRSFRITDKSRLTFRSEWFNAFNHPNFGTPDATIGAATAGTTSATVAGPGGTAPRVIQLAMKYKF